MAKGQGRKLSYSTAATPAGAFSLYWLDIQCKHSSLLANHLSDRIFHDGFSVPWSFRSVNVEHKLLHAYPAKMMENAFL